MRGIFVRQLARGVSQLFGNSAKGHLERMLAAGRLSSPVPGDVLKSDVSEI
jgi:hypothetical protein